MVNITKCWKNCHAEFISASPLEEVETLNQVQGDIIIQYSKLLIMFLSNPFN